MHRTLYLVFICATVFAVKSVSALEDPPDITLLLKYKGSNKYNIKCVAGSSVDTALTFVAPLYFNLQNPVSQYFLNDGSTLGNRFNCDFESISSCTESWTKYNEYNVKLNVDYDIIPISDARWEKFDTHYTTKRDTVKIDDGITNNIQISVRTSGAANLLLCEKDIEKEIGNCYWITIDETFESNILSIRHCPALGTKQPRNNLCSKTIIKETEKILSESQWCHFSIIKDNDMLKLTESTRGLLIELDTKMYSLNIQFIYLSAPMAAVWKFHKFRYLSLKNEHTEFQQIGPSYIAKKDEPFCLTFYVALCTTCKISFIFYSGIPKVTPTKSTQPYPVQSKWQKIQISSNVRAGQEYGLYVTNTNKQKNQQGYWLIRDMRECHIKEMRKVSLDNIDFNYYKPLSCYALNYPLMFVRQENIYKAPDIENHFCNDTHHIGQSCNISCNAVFERDSSYSEHCNGHIICKYTTTKHRICACTSGYIGDNCAMGCSNDMYGYNCKHACGHCEHDRKCGKASGTCIGKCEDGFVNDEKLYCQTLQYPRLEQPPSLIYSTLSEIKVKFNSSPTIGLKKAEMYQIQYKDRSVKHYEAWANYTDVLQLQSANHYTLDEKLARSTDYIIRVVLYPKNMYKYYNGSDVPELEVSTKCINVPNDLNSIKNIKLEATSTKIIIRWTPICAKDIEIKLTCDQEINDWCKEEPLIIAVLSTRGYHTMTSLIPFTKYMIQIKDIQSNKMIHDTGLMTEPDVPPKVDLTVYSKGGNYISIRWRAPYPPNGHLEKYQLSYQLEEVPQPTAIEIPIQNCHLWDGYLCYNLTHLLANKIYFIFIQSKNWNISGFSDASIEQIYTWEDKSEAPLHFSTNWDTHDILILKWTHPNITNGDLVAFNIIFVQLATSLKKNIFQTTISKMYINEPYKTYQYKVTEHLPFSSLYQISIQGVNKIDGELVSIKLDTPPETPKLAGNVSTNEITNHSRTITIPAVNQSTVSDTSFIILAICDTHGVKNTDNIKNILVYNISVTVNCNGAMRIAATFEALITYEIKFKIGSNDNSTRTSRLQTLINNNELKSTENVYLVLANEYGSQWRYSVYTIIDTPVITSNNLQYILYTLLVLLFVVPIIGWIGYRYMKVKNRISETNDIRMANISINSVATRFNLRSHNKDAEDESSTKSLIKNTSKSIIKQTNLLQINHLAEYVKKAIEDGELESQHASFKKGQTKSWDYGTKNENKFKNRYNNIAAYDDTRVILKRVAGDPFSDYINANYIDGYRRKNAYIATQGPKLTTINDFWRMIWQEKVEYIVMLANITEGGKKKCEQYWPDLNETRECMNMEIKFVNSQIFADYEYRTFEIKNENQTRKIEHLHFTSWPDHGVPVYPQALVPFLRKILQVSVGRAPIVVHCSAGVGRTGTIILCDICLRMAAKEQAVDVLQYFQKMRDHRANMVDNFEQFKLVHIVLLECLLAPDTNIPCDRNFESYVEQIIIDGTLQSQMSYLIDTAWHYQVMKTNKITDTNDNQHKNRFSNIVPGYNRIYLKRYPIDDEHSDYINAIPVDGFRMKDQFIVTQTPQPNTVSDFWRMVDQFDVQVIVSLNEIILNDKTSCVFWPAENGEIMITSYLKIKFHSSKVNEYFVLYNIEMKNTSKEDGRISIINLVQYKNWKPEMCTPKNIETFVRLLEEVQNLSRQRKPTIVTCFDGTKASGLFVALSFAIEKVKLEQKCDVCLAVRVIRQNRSEFIQDKKQFEFLYKAVVNYIASFETYSNFNIRKIN